LAGGINEGRIFIGRELAGGYSEEQCPAEEHLLYHGCYV